MEVVKSHLCRYAVLLDSTVVVVVVVVVVAAAAVVVVVNYNKIVYCFSLCSMSSAFHFLSLLIFRSTPPSRPNNISESQMSVRPSVHKKFLQF